MKIETSQPSKRDIADALDALVAVDPQEGLYGPCHHCRAQHGSIHEEGCAWLEARFLLDGNREADDLRVGESDDARADRLEGEPFTELETIG